VEEGSPLRVAVISRYALIRTGLTSLIHAAPGRAVVVDAAERDGHLRHLDVVVYDLAGLTGGENVDDLRHLLHARLPVVGLVRDRRADLADGAHVLGLRSVVSEQISSEELIEHLERAAGRTVLARRLRQPHGAALTERERNVLRLVATGLSNQQIADQLYLSINSVKTYVRTAYKKINATTRAEAVIWAIRYGLVPPPTPADDVTAP
jgi:DNA-binding NarL/FixJ family response regulator